MQLNASASVPGALVYTPAAGTVPSAGTVTLSVTFTPTDTTDYTSTTKTVQLTVNQATSGITWNTPGSIIYGTALSSLQLDATASDPGTLVYTPGAGTVLPAGNNTLSVTFTPTDTTNHSGATQTVQLVVTQAAPVITWNNPASITYGTALSTTQLNASASVPGTLVYTPTAGVVPAAGTDTLSVTFTHRRHQLLHRHQDRHVDSHAGCSRNYVGSSGKHRIRHGTVCRPAQCDGIGTRHDGLHACCRYSPGGWHNQPVGHVYPD